MTCIRLLRGVNLGGRNMVSMTALRELLASLGFEDVRTLLHSGNVVFRSRRRRNPAALEATLQEVTAERLGVSTHYIVRTADDWQAMIAANPFPREAEREPHRLLLTALKEEPPRGAIAALTAAIPGRETLRVIGRHAYIVYPDGLGRSRLTNALIEKTLGTRATARNWNTVLRIAELTGRL